MKFTLFGVVAALSLFVVAVSAARASDGFRMENRLYLETDKEPANESTTIFLSGSVYDYLKKPAEVFVFDRPRNQFILLDPLRRRSATLTTQEVAAFTDQLLRRLESQPDPFLQFLANPRFEQGQPPQPDGGTWTFSSPKMSYEIESIRAPEPAMSHAYREFSDWLARVSPMLEPSARPPFARMQINAALAEHNLLPQRVQLTMTPKQGLLSKRITIHSEHELVTRLSESDLDRVTQTRQFIAIFSSVSVAQFCRK
jgi:hypothetical protein